MDLELAELSRTLFSPVTLLLFAGGMLLHLYATAFGTVDRDDAETSHAGRRARLGGTVLTWAGIATLVAHIVTRWMASGRPPLGNMFEFSTLMALIVVVAGVIVLRRLARPELMGFVLLGTLLTMGAALLVYAEPGPLMPILDSWWRGIHVSTIVFAAGIFTLGFVFTALYLLRDVAEQRVADQQTARARGSTVGAAESTVALDEDERDTLEDAVPERTSPDADEGSDDHAYGQALREAINPWRLAGWTWLATGALSWVWLDVGRFVIVNTTMAVAALIAWRFVASLPSAATLDSMAYRTIAFGFPIWTFGVISGAIWAEQSWGRYWGWDPKETSAFLTWVAYAGYLHTRATKGWRGRKAAIVGIVAYGVLMFTYFAVNLLITGLHSYAGLQ